MGLEPSDVLFIAIVHLARPLRSSMAMRVADAAAVCAFPRSNPHASSNDASKSRMPGRDRHRRRPGRPCRRRCALAPRAIRVQLLEARPFLGGRATSYEAGSETIDNCQHILLRCCVNLLDFYARLGVADDIAFHREFVFIEPGGRRSMLRAGMLPPPTHFAGSFLGLQFLNLAEKLAVARGILRHPQRERPRAISTASPCSNGSRRSASRRAPSSASGVRCWSAPSTKSWTAWPPRTAFKCSGWVFWRERIPTRWACPRCRSAQLYAAEAWERNRATSRFIRARPSSDSSSKTDQVRPRRCVGGERDSAPITTSALCRSSASAAVGPDLASIVTGFEHSPITGIHLWFDRPVTDLPHATLLDRTIQWMFNKSEGRYMQLVVSASRSLVEMPRADVIALALRELAEFFPAVREAKLEKAHVVKEIRATFSAAPGLESRRPAEPHVDPQPVSRRRLDPLRLARDHGRRGPQRLSGRRSRDRSRRRAAKIPAARYRVR